MCQKVAVVGGSKDIDFKNIIVDSNKAYYFVTILLLVGLAEEPPSINNGAELQTSAAPQGSLRKPTKLNLW